nr:hypothetical protein CFP56_75063 [Quercus suber]
MLRRYIINPQGPQDHLFYCLLIPRIEIPKWFNHQNVGASVNLQVPSDLSCNKLMGIAVCAVFVFRQHHPLHQLPIQDLGYIIDFGAEWTEILNQVDTNGFSQIEVKFEPEGPGLEVTKCGAHLLLWNLHCRSTFFLSDFLCEEVFGLCWKGETVTLLADEKACGTGCMVVIFVQLCWMVH